MADFDIARGADGASVAVGLTQQDSVRWSPRIRVDKYTDQQVAHVAWMSGVAEPDGDLLAKYASPYETIEADGNLLTTAGLNRLTSLMIAAGGQAATATATRIGVGNSATAAAVGQTDLQAAAGAANRYFMPMDATYPTQANGVLTFKASFATADGNFVWNEWCVDIGTPTVVASAVVSALMLNRKVESLGTKVSGTWVLTTTITIS